MKKNFYGGSCKVCGVPVAANEGAVKHDGTAWRVHCLPCSGEVPNAPVSIKVNRHVTGEVIFIPSGRLGDRFNAYVSALSGNGARYDGTNNLAKIDRALGCIAALEKAEFILQVHPDVSATLQAFAAQHKANVAEAGARASKVDEALRERGLALYPFQGIGTEWLAARMRALLADDRGLGKTIQTLIAIPEGAPVLVIGPQAAMGVWGDETPRWRPDLTVTSVEAKDFHWPAKGEMVICSYGCMPDLADFERLGKMTDGTVLIADEAQAIKNPKTKRTKRFREMSHRARTGGGRVWLLSGSPLLNEPPELWAILQAAGLGTEAFGSYWNFCAMFNATQDTWGKTIFREASSELPEKLRKVMLRRLKRDVLTDLPETTFRVVHVPIDHRFETDLNKAGEQLKLHIPSVYDWMRAGPAAWEEGSLKPGQTHPDPKVNSEEIRQALAVLRSNTGASFHAMSHMRELLAVVKIPAMLNYVAELEEANTPALVFSAHRAPIDQLGQREGWVAITGDIDGADRQKIATDFQNGKYKGLALTIDAGGVALTLTRAAEVIFVDREFNPSLNNQAIDRAVRIGQTRGITVTDLVANHYLDRRIAEILELKERIIQSSVEASAIKADERPELPEGLAEVDFTKLQTVAQTSLQGYDAAKAEAERIAAERAKNAAELRAKQAEEAKERKIREQGQKRYEAARQRAIGRGWVEAADHPDRRAPQGAVEEWAAAGLATLSGLDPDRATSRNDVGFSKSDSYLGHWLTVEIARGLTPNQWQLAITLCRPYHRQIGPCPKAAEKEAPSSV